MYLSKLEIYGFKSFAHKVLFKFSDGVAAIVGPNGCGKSNVVDAIRWVLGEQKTSVLRSEQMENVIFNGSKARKALGFAEVTMTIQNNKKILPSEYTEVTISRRLFRNGESQYFINKSKSRLKDIISLFMDTGMGADSYSVIELKMVEAILSGKIDERRHLFEEAAGVNKYKLRRKEAGKKLESVQTDLVRVEDIRKEVEKNVGSLSRQASKTKKYNKLLDELKQLETQQFAFEYNQIYQNSLNLLDELSGIESERDNSANEYNQLTAKLDELQKERSVLDRNLINSQRQEEELSHLLHSKKQDIAVSKQRLTNLIEMQERNEKDIDDIQLALKKQNSEADEIKLIMLEKSSSKLQIESNLNNAREAYSQAYEQTKSLRSEVSAKHDEILMLQNKIESINSVMKRNKSREDALKQKMAYAKDEIERQNIQLDQLNEDIESKHNNKTEAESQADSISKELESTRELKTVIERKRDKLKDELLLVNNQIIQKQSEFDFLSGLIETSESSKFLIQSKEWIVTAEKATFGELIGIDEEYKVAINSALGEAAHYFVTENRDEAESAIALLRSKSKGKATFICKEMIPERAELKPINDDRFKRLTGLIRADEAIINAVYALIGDMIIAENIESAYDALANGIAESAVTYDGSIIMTKGIIGGGSVSKEEAVSIGKKERLDSLVIKINQLTKERNIIEKAIEDLQEELAGFDFVSLELELKKADNLVISIIHQIESLTAKAGYVQQNIASIGKNIIGFEEESNSIHSENAEHEDQLNQAQFDLIALQDDFSFKSELLDGTESEILGLQENLRQAEKEAVVIAGEIKNLENQLKSVELRRKEMIAQAEIKNSDIEISKDAIKMLQEKIETLTAETADNELQYLTAKNEYDLMANKVEALGSELESLSTEATNKRKIFDQLSNNYHECELKLSGAKSKLQSLLERAAEQYQINLEVDSIEISGEFDQAESRNAIKILRERLNSLGSVNFLALDEFEKESERLDFYNKQIKDLVDSEKTLQDTILEINRTAEEKFTSTFDQINTNFKSLFKTLFSEEGEGELKLGEGNPLECDIEIIAKPPGKKPHSIEQISSGEKTLTAIALLFAIYLVKPSPFCILDEVDAPLDDANIDKFLGLIHQFSDNTQFLIVTHNKRTMEAANTLYGITMEEEGVSKVVSVKLASELV